MRCGGQRPKSTTIRMGVQCGNERSRLGIADGKETSKGAGPKGPSLLSEAAYNGNAGIGGCGTLGGRV